MSAIESGALLWYVVTEAAARPRAPLLVPEQVQLLLVVVGREQGGKKVFTCWDPWYKLRTCWEGWPRAELVVTLAQLDGVAEELTEVVRRLQDEVEYGWPDLFLMERLNQVLVLLEKIAWEMERWGEWPSLNELSVTRELLL